MRKLMLGLALGALVACGGTGTVTGPEEVSGVPGGGEPTAVAATPAPVAPVTTPSKDVEAWIGNYGKFYAKNLAGTPAVFVFYTTSFDNQNYQPGDPKKVMTVQPGDFFEGSFDTTCRQVDGAFNSTDGRIFVSAFINHEGKPVPANQIDRSKCAPTPRPTPEPSPSPSPSPSPDPQCDDDDCGEDDDDDNPSCDTDDCDDDDDEEEPGVCYYTISGEPQGSDRSALCQQAAGPKYLNWNDSANHCIVNLPGVYKDVIPEFEYTDDKGKKKKAKVHFNLVPGQSDDDCRKHDTPN